MTKAPLGVKADIFTQIHIMLNSRINDMHVEMGFETTRCEHTKILEPRDVAGVPRLVKWDLKELNEKMEDRGFEDVNNSDVFEALLQPTIEEIKLIGFPFEEVPTHGIEEECEGCSDKDANLSEQVKEFEGERGKYNEFDNGENTLLTPLVNTVVDNSGMGATENSVEYDCDLVTHLRVEIQHLNDRLNEQSALITCLENHKSTMTIKLVEAEVHTVTQVAEHSNENLQTQVSKLKSELQQNALSYESILCGKNEIIQSHLETIAALREEVHKLQNENEEEKTKREAKEKNDENELEKQSAMNQQLPNDLHQIHQDTLEGDDILIEPTKEAPKVKESSYVKRLKNRERKPRELPDYTYENQHRRVQRRKTEEGAIVVPAEQQPNPKEMIISVGKRDVKTKAKATHTVPFNLKTNVAKLLHKDDIVKLGLIHDLHGAGTVVWLGKKGSIS